MEFIPLEKYSKKAKKSVSVDFEKSGKKKELKKAEIAKDETLQKTKSSVRTKVLEKKVVKNKYRELLTLKRKQKAPKKKAKKEIDEVEKEQEKEDEDVEEEEVEAEDEDVEEEGVEAEDDDAVEEEEEKNDEEDAFKRKCKEMDEKKKNRLFVKLKKKIYSEAQIKELHPDIRSVIFPRKKKSRWCWAVFASEERADEALKKLIKNKEIYATKPTPYDKVDARRKEKMKVVLRKKEARKKLRQMWTSL